jgi:DNA adenine methylase
MIMSSVTMKPLITYYGGKQKLATTIVPLLAPHNLYCEPFFGGGAIFFAKEVSNVEVINDTNRELMNFYRQVQHNFIDLEKEIRISLHSRDLHRQAKVINENPDMFNELKRAWAIWVLAAQSFASKLDGPWGYDIKKHSTSLKITNKRSNFTEEYAIRLMNVQIECADALRIMTSRDSPDSFFYLDPPYFNSNMGHYNGYTEDDFRNLLDKCANLEGKFLLSSYPSDILEQYRKEYGWDQRQMEMRVSVNKGYGKRKIEVLTANYPITDK